MDAWLLERADSLAALLLGGLRHRIAIYRDVPDEILAPATRQFVGHFLAALRTGEAEPLLALGYDNLERRFGSGLPVEAGMQLTQPLRDAFLAVLRPAFEERVKGLYEVLLAANPIFDKLDA